jgi:hypothetical protein
MAETWRLDCNLILLVLIKGPHDHRPASQISATRYKISRKKKKKKKTTPKHVRSQFGVGLRTFWGSRPAGLREKIDTKQSVHKPKLYFFIIE